MSGVLINPKSRSFFWSRTIKLTFSEFFIRKLFCGKYEMRAFLHSPLVMSSSAKLYQKIEVKFVAEAKWGVTSIVFRM